MTAVQRSRILTGLHDSAYRVVPFLPFDQWFLPVAYSPHPNSVLGMPGLIM